MNNGIGIFPFLAVVEQGGIVKSFSLDKDQFTIGRDPAFNDICINSSIVSSQHGIITNINGTYVYNDLASTNGTNIRGTLIKGFNNMPSDAVRINDGDMLSIGSNDYDRVYLLFTYSTQSNILWQVIPLASNPVIRIGRGPDNTIVIPNVTVSRNHAEISYNNGQPTITDLKSSNGTLVNGNMINGTAPLTNMAVVKIGTSFIARTGDYILYGTPSAAKVNNVVSYKENMESKQLPSSSADNDHYEYAHQGGVSVDVQNMSKLVSCKNGTGINGGNKKYILYDVSLTINPGELVAILGGSGAGKTTFMNCINGFEPATEGRVYVNGSDLYRNYQALKASIGYVPQQDIVHDNLTVEDMLMYTGKLRLPKDITKQELSQRVAEVLDMVDLTAQKDTYIKKLSGGQRKRASIAVELVSDPTLFFLDEPTSGLDPEAETNLMHRLRDLSTQKGKTVIVITHTLQNIRLFDKVVFLAPGGKLCFCGTPKEACKFFEVDNLIDAYEKIGKDIDGYIEKYNKYREAK